MQIFAVTGDDVVRFELDGSFADNVDQLLTGVEARCLAVDPDDPHRLYVGTLNNGLYVSDDGGLNWRAQPPGIDSLLVGLRGGTLLLSDDAGESWTQLSLRLDDVIELHAIRA